MDPRQIGGAANMSTRIITIAHKDSKLYEFDMKGLFIGTFDQFCDCFGYVEDEDGIADFAEKTHCWVKFYDVPHDDLDAINEWCIQYPLSAP